MTDVIAEAGEALRHGTPDRQVTRRLFRLAVSLVDERHARGHRLVWQRTDRPELRCSGLDGGLRCHLVVGHTAGCHG